MACSPPVSARDRPKGAACRCSEVGDMVWTRIRSPSTWYHVQITGRGDGGEPPDPVLFGENAEYFLFGPVVLEQSLIEILR